MFVNNYSFLRKFLTHTFKSFCMQKTLEYMQNIGIMSLIRAFKTPEFSLKI